MATSIPFDPALVLGNLIHPEDIKKLEDIATAQKPVDVAQNKLNQSKKFLSEGDKVKFTMRFRGREVEHPEFGQRVLDNFKDELSTIAEVESTSKPDGKSLTMVLAPNGVKN